MSEKIEERIGPQTIEEAFGMPEYLVFLILGYIRELRKLQPDHILVKAVEAALETNPDPGPKPEQLELLDVPAFLKRQA